MRLAKIKLAGFKSFVDPTQIRIPSNRVGVVGPNGCGKSNIIDAVRWVLGESSAKHLRGGSMADVIFSGSSGRKPVGQASIELTFDNSEGKAGGEYAKYAEIAIRREVHRDGQSNYYLNGARCRRRDITDLFLGTGLGPRSYAIIEQGMITRVIEAKPEEMRSFLEEAAGISKYKERRRETENRIRHTQENLSRLNDLREEVEKQLDHLKRQARTAEKYKELKQKEREAQAGLLAVRIQDLDRSGERQRAALNAVQTELEAAIAEQRGVELELEQSREAQGEAGERLNQVQARYYEVGAEISRLEQAIQHARELSRRQTRELQEAERALGEIDEHLTADAAERETLRGFLEENEPKLEEARAREEAAREDRRAAEEALQAWQNRWDAFNEKAAEPARIAEVERSRIDQFDRLIRQHDQRLERLQRERETLTPAGLEEEAVAMAAEAEALEADRERVSEELDALRERIATLRDDGADTARRRDELRLNGQRMGERLASLKALQQAALGVDDQTLEAWLREHGLDAAQRLARRLDVDAGWEKAVESVLGPHLQALCVERWAAADLNGLPGGCLELLVSDGPAADAPWPSLDAPRLADHVRGAAIVRSLLAGSYCVETAAEAETLAACLRPGETVVTRDGLLMGPGWLRRVADGESGSGVLEREHEIKRLVEENDTLAGRLAETVERLEEQRAGVRDLEMRRDGLTADRDAAHRRIGDVRARLSAREARLEQIRARGRRLDEEIVEVREQIETERMQMEEAHGRRARAVEAMEALTRERETLAGESDRHRGHLDEARATARGLRDEAHRLDLEVRSRGASLKSLAQNVDRLVNQREQIRKRLETLQASLQAAKQPSGDLGRQLEAMLERRVEAEADLTAARTAVGELDNRLRELDRRRMSIDQQAQDLRSRAEKQRLELKQVEVKREDQAERLAESGFDADALLVELGEDEQVGDWETRVADLGRGIGRLGPINLAAIDEYREQGERKTYLDAQHADLSEAMATLESAIRKIDKETRTRFKATFDRVNAKLQEMFPRLFGGGHAHLELTDDDLLETGVSILARPPGKRISSIQLLSGGEKALTAVALVFAFFELNPAPFCMLDEVDAPLDDANVGRFCDLVREMSERVQFVFISHNKTTMEMANELLGVTMHEPGVSRLVAVDVDEAVRLAEL